jgi:hypothetical protein
MVAAVGVATWRFMDPLHDPPPEPVLSEPRHRELIHGDTTRTFQERDYTPPYVLEGWRVPRAGQATTPELALVRMASAIRNGDWDLYVSLWDDKGRQTLTTELERMHARPEHRIARWREATAGRTLIVVKRRDIPGYAMLTMVTDGDPPAAVARTLPLALKADAEGRWWFTHDLREDPVLAIDVMLPKGATLR